MVFLISTMKFDGQFTIKNGVPEGLKDLPNSPGVYVVYEAPVRRYSEMRRIYRNGGMPGI
jgi:hypothetical protein